jgi:hypothetical protein
VFINYRLITGTVFNPDRGERFTPSLNYPDRPWGPPSLLFSGYRVSFPGIERQGREAASSPLSGAEVKNDRSYTFTASLEWHNFLSLVGFFKFFSYLLYCYDPWRRVLFSDSYLKRLSVSVVPSN